MVLPPAPVINASGEKVPGRGPQKVTTRWRPGKAPEWAPEAKAEGFASGGSARASRLVEEPAILSEVGALTHDATDRRLRRLAEVRASGRQRDVADAEILEPGDEDEDDDRHARRARREEEEEQEDEEQEQENAASDEDESEDEDKLEARRARVREMAKRRLADKGDQELMGEEEEDEEKAKGESSDSWEYETDSEEEDNMRLIKPVFVSKAARGTLEERERIEKEEAEEEKMKQLRLEQRKKDTRKLVAEELQKEKQAMVDRQMRQKREDTDEEGNEEEEYDKWRLRELKRIKRDREARDRFEREKSDTDRRRTMTDAQIMAENASSGKATKSKAAMVFMQKYHHKGAFFMENDESNRALEGIYNRDTNEATEADKATAKLAQNGPYEGSKVLQVRRGKLGKMGQTKWTHLTDQDTSKQDSPWAIGDEKIRQKLQKKMGGFA